MSHNSGTGLISRKRILSVSCKLAKLNEIISSVPCFEGSALIGANVSNRMSAGMDKNGVGSMSSEICTF